MAMQWMSPCAALTRGYTLHDLTLSEPSEKKVELDAQLSFNIGETGLLCKLDDVTDISFPPEIYHVPNTMNWMLGLANVRGLLVPVVDLHIVLGIKAPKKIKNMLVILSEGDDVIGFLSDGLPRRQFLHENDKLARLPNLPPLLQDFVFTGYSTDGNTWLTLDHKKLFDMLSKKVTSIG